MPGITVSTDAPTVSRKDQRKQEADRRRRLKPLLDAVKKAESDLERYHQQQQALEEQLAAPSIYEEGEKQKLKTVLAEKAKIDSALMQAEEDWMSAEEQLAAAE